MDALKPLATQLAEMLSERHLSVAVAESCTGGWIAKVLTDIPGSSAWFDRGFVTYSNNAKQDMLGVKTTTLQQHGAVSQAVAIEMALGACQHSEAQLSVAVTGIAGPGGGTPDKPVGTVWLAWLTRSGEVSAVCRQFEGDREAVRRQAVATALQGLLDGLA